MINKEEYEKMLPWKNKLQAAGINNFVRIPRSELNKINALHGEIFGESLNKTQINCSHCVLKMCKEMWAAMKEYREWYEHHYKREL